MLLGENGTGKSTILQAIALTLVGASAVARLGTTADVIRKTSSAIDASPAPSALKLSGFVAPHRLTFRHDRIEFKSPTGEPTTMSFTSGPPSIEGTGWEPQTVLLAYGPHACFHALTQTLEQCRTGTHTRPMNNLSIPSCPSSTQRHG